MQCVILAGGLGMRLLPLTQTLPKALLPINGRPFVDYQLDWIARQGITDVVICIGYLGERIADHVGDGARYKLVVRYADEGRDLMGTGGALRHALDQSLLADAFFVLYGDSFLPIAFPPMFEFFRSSGKSALMAVMRNDNRWDRSNVIYTPPMVTLYDKKCEDDAVRNRMTHIDYGLSVLSRSLIESIPAEVKVDLADVFHRLSVSGDLSGFEVMERFYEVGSPAGAADFSRFVLSGGI